MKINRRFTRSGQSPFDTVEYEKRTSRITNPDGRVVFEMNDAEMPRPWSQLATDIMVSKYFRKAGVPQVDEHGQPLRDANGNVVTGPEKSAKQVIHRLVGCWRHWGEKHGYFDTAADAQTFYDELSHMLLHQMCAPNSPQWFNTGLNWAYNITGPAQGHFYCDPQTGELQRGKDAYTHPQPHACQPYRAPVSTPAGPMPIGKIVVDNLIGLEVYDGSEHGSGITHVVAVKANGTKPVLRIVLEDGVLVEATGDHLVYAEDSDGLSGRWVRVDSLDKSMSLLRVVRDRAAEKAAEKLAAGANSPGGAQPVTTTHVYKLRQIAIKRVERIGVHAVYDIQTESGQYLSNNVIVHNCFIQSVSDDLVNSGGIMDLWTREARLFKYGSGTGSNFSKLRGENEPLSGGGKSSGLMSFLKIGDRAAGAIKSGGTTRRAAKMVCLDLDHPDIQPFVNWKVREELKVSAMAEGMKHLPKDYQDLAKKLGLKLDYDFNGEAYATVSGQNSNNSVRIPNSFFKAVEEDGAWNLISRTSGKVAESLRARDLWDQVAFAAWRCADPGVQYDDTINQWHTCPRSGRINASNPCVTGDTRVLTPGGIWRRIDSMIHLPARVMTNLNGQHIHATEGAFPTGTKEVFELRTQGGYRVNLTAEHLVWTRSRGWIAAKNLTAGDEVKLPHQPAAVQAIGEPQEPQLFQLLGLFASTANGCGESLSLDASLTGVSDTEPLMQYISQRWSEQSTYDDDYVNTLMLDDSDCGSIGGAATATLTNRRLLSRLRAYVYMEDGQRRLGDDAFTAGLPAQKHLLRGLFTADGTIRNGVLELHSDSLGLIQDVQLLLLGFGVQSAIYNETSGKGGAVAFDGGAVENRERLPERPTETSSASGRRADADFRRHGLRIDSGSLRTFARHIGLLPGHKAEQLATAASYAMARPDDDNYSANSGNFDKMAGLFPVGRRQVFDITEPVTHSFIANGLTLHNCSEYMFLDDTACNLASLNVLTFFDPESRHFDVEGFRHAIRLWTIVLEISVLMASFPSEEIAQRSYKFRTLGLGFANLGAMLMQAGIPYDSDKARAICAALSAVLTGEAYLTSAVMAGELGAFAGYPENKADMLRVIRNHRRAAYNVTHEAAARKTVGDYETLDIKPVGIDATQFNDSDPLASTHLLQAARQSWDEALALGEKHGFRNAQTTVIAPTGTIGLLMDCDTTGVEPDFALVKFKKLSGGGYFKIANQSLRPALQNLGYSAEQIHAILKYVMGSLSLHDSPHINYQSLKQLGFTEREIDGIEQGLPGVFELGFAFSPYNFSPQTLERLNIHEPIWKSPNFNMLLHLGFTKRQINEANAWICGNGTVEGAPHLRLEHYDVFDCANKCGKIGLRFIEAEGHIRMMASAQPFISGAISKTINLPNEATVDDIKQSYFLSWQLGLKANALYRDGSKLSQPLNVKSDEDLDKKTDADDEEAVDAARLEVADEVVRAAGALFHPVTSDNLSGAHTKVVEKIVERIVERPLRRRLADTRNAMTHKFDVSGHEGYVTVGLYEDGSPGEIFIRMAKEGSTIGGLMDTIATLVSVSLQYGVPVESLVRKFEHVRFEPSGMTRNSDIPFAKSLVDYIFRWLAMEFVHGYRAANAPHREPPATEPAATETAANAPAKPAKRGGNGHGPRLEPDTAKSFPYTEDEIRKQSIPAPAPAGDNLRVTIMSDPLSQLNSNLQADAPACDVCGSITVRSGTCYKCQNCGNSMGCS